MTNQVTTFSSNQRLWHTSFGDVEGSLKKSLKDLQLDYVDLYLIHFPLGYNTELRKPLHVLWPEIENLVAKGLTKSIGVSNFNTQFIWDLLTYAKIPPAVNEIEINPQNTNSELVRFLHAKNIRPLAYTPVSRLFWDHKSDPDCPDNWYDLSKNELLPGCAQKYEESMVQIMLNWGLCKGHAVIPKAAKSEHQKENMDIFDFKLTDEEIMKIDKLNKDVRFSN